MPLVEPPGGTALKHVQPDWNAVAIALLQQCAQDGRADAAALEARLEIEVLQPMTVLGRTQGDAPGEATIHLDHSGMRGHERISQPLPNPVRVVPPEPLKIRPHHDSPQLRDRLDIGSGSRPNPQSAMQADYRALLVLGPFVLAL
ncbi:MAG TPA: hypothetical protein VHG10_12900 [Glycomyces sp.]|nr:hypothetical protein [Glycomyces sp.]